MFGKIGSTSLVVVSVIIGAVVALTLVSNLLPTYSGAVKSISQNVSTADWGNTTANSLGPTFAMVISLGGLFAIIGLIFLGYSLKKNA